VAQEVADRLAVAITNARLMKGLQETSARVAAMSQRVVELQETERRDIARELHDEIGQVLTAVKLRLGLLAPDVTPPLCERIKETERLVDDLVANVRRLSLTLRPPLLDDLGLQGAVSAHLERFEAQTGIHVSFTAGALDDRRLPLDVETAAFRIVQEALTNVARHARTSDAQVWMQLDLSRHLDISIFDSGCGFDPSNIKPGSAGLAGMSDRVALLGGSFRIDSGDSGTRITARIPIRSVSQS
jgi:signal transduction histidine kinase